MVSIEVSVAPPWEESASTVSTIQKMTVGEEHPLMQTGMITRLIREPPDKEYHLDVCGYQYPSPLMEPVIGNTVRGLKNNYGLVLNVLNVPNSTVAKRTVLKETSNK